VLALAVVLFFYAANSEVAWLFLIAYWVAAFVIASIVYAAWNNGMNVTVRVTGMLHAAAFAPEGLAEQVAREEAFEGDRLRVEIRLESRRRTRGPGRATGRIGVMSTTVAAGVVSKEGRREERILPPVRRGPVMVSGWSLEAGDPLGLFRARTGGEELELALVLPRFASLKAQPLVRELEASVNAPRAGTGTEIFGVREYRPGDPLRRIHWRSTARRGELIVREFEPPAVQNLGIFCDPDPASDVAADQVARLAASEAWDCIRAGGRVTLWAPGCEPSRPDEERNLLALLEWLARYPRAGFEAGLPPRVGDAIAVTTKSDPRLLEAVDAVRWHGGSVRAWVVGDAALDLDITVERAGLGWPL
jgi:uncharacterized protein (DUF58 family)